MSSKEEGASQFHIMVKPSGPLCNMECIYCYYLSKKNFFKEDENYRISDELLERFIQQYINEQDYNQINFTWQGGEPTLLGLEFFKKVIEFQKKHCPSGKKINNDLQTNGTLIDDDWCRFLHENKFLVGLSTDGPKDLNDIYRLDRKKHSVFDRVYCAAELMRKHHVEFNTLTVVNRINAKRPYDVYNFLRNEIGSRYMQFIPCVEPVDFEVVAPGFRDIEKLPKVGDIRARPGIPDSIVTEWSVDPDDYGDFLIKIFDRWYKKDVGKIFIINFESSLNLWMGMPSPVCYLSDICGKSLAIEHDGSVYSCDHYVYPQYRLGNIKEKSLCGMAFSGRQMEFGFKKNQSLPEYCRQCKFLFTCHGECPRNRFLRTPGGEFELNYLCTGLYKYFNHIEPYMKLMAGKIRAAQPETIIK